MAGEFRFDEPHRRGPQMRRTSRAQTRIALIVVALAVGLLVGVQVSSRDRQTSRLAAESPEDLTRILADLNEEADALARQVTDLRLKLQRYESSSTRDDQALDDVRKTLADLEVLAGTTPVRGPGVTVAIEDPGASVSWEPFLDLIQELRDAGAEAIAVNGVRVVASTWLGPSSPGVTVDGETIASPYTIEAIGAASAIREALAIPGGPVSLLQAQPGLTVEVSEATGLRLPALRREIRFEYARPAT